MASSTLRDPDVLNLTSIIDNYMLLSDETDQFLACSKRSKHRALLSERLSGTG